MLKRFLPLLILGALIVVFAKGFGLKPREIPSALIDKPVPEFSLPLMEGDGTGFTAGDLKAEEGIVLVNFFASWCAPCIVEHASLMALAEKGYKIYGVNYKDRPGKGPDFIAKHGNPYVAIGADVKGRTAIDWGVYGVPETFFIKGGRIVHKHIGPIHESDLDRKILPLLKELTS